MVFIWATYVYNSLVALSRVIQCSVWNWLVKVCVSHVVIKKSDRLCVAVCGVIALLESVFTHHTWPSWMWSWDICPVTDDTHMKVCVCVITHTVWWLITHTFTHEWRCVWWVTPSLITQGVCDEWRCVWWVKVCVMSEGVCVCDEWEISSLYFACPIVKLVSGLELKNKIHYLSVFAVSLRVFMRTSSLLYSVFSRELNQWTLLTQFAMYRKCTCVLALPGTHNPLIFFVVCKSIYVCDIIFVYSPQVHTCRTVIFCSARGRPIHARQW